MNREKYARILGRDRVGRWARAAIDAARTAGPPPRYGSQAWLDLPTNDPRRMASVLIAAECWRLECDPEWTRARLDAESDAAHSAAVQEHEAMWRQTMEWIGRVDRARDAGADVGLPLDQRVELARRPRPGDRLGAR